MIANKYNSSRRKTAFSNLKKYVKKEWERREIIKKKGLAMQNIASPLFALMLKYEALLLFFEHVLAYAAQGALVIFGQLFALVDITADDTYILLHNFSPSNFEIKQIFRFGNNFGRRR